MMCSDNIFFYKLRKHINIVYYYVYYDTLCLVLLHICNLYAHGTKCTKYIFEMYILMKWECSTKNWKFWM